MDENVERERPGMRRLRETGCVLGRAVGAWWWVRFWGGFEPGVDLNVDVDADVDVGSDLGFDRWCVGGGYCEGSRVDWADVRAPKEMLRMSEVVSWADEDSMSCSESCISSSCCAGSCSESCVPSSCSSDDSSSLCCSSFFQVALSGRSMRAPF